jgi:hypothetical protein
MMRKKEPSRPPDGMPSCISFVIAMQLVLIAIFLILAALTEDWDRLRFWILALAPLEISALVSVALYYSGQQSCNLHLAILAMAAFCTIGLWANNLSHVAG